MGRVRFLKVVLLFRQAVFKIVVASRAPFLPHLDRIFAHALHVCFSCRMFSWEPSMWLGRYI